MLIANLEAPFDSPDYLYELKFDGIRCLAYITKDSVDLRNKRNKDITALFPELNEIYCQVNSRCILDGEIVVIKGNKPDFFEVQKRTIMTNPFKIKLQADRLPASFVAYDIILLDNKLLIDKGLEERKELINKTIYENERIAISKVFDNGVALFELCKSQGLEGVVAKRKGSKYFFGKLSKDWIKFKVLEDKDYVICGYIQKPNNMTSIIIGQYNNKKELIYKGHVTLGSSLRALNQHKYTIIDHPPFNTPVPTGNEYAVWLKPELVCIVEYMPSNKDGLRQPVFKGIRDDKSPKDCLID
ncbi:DNA ligase [Beduini sp.]|uniref:ATP-dependent DNA ligase n=1 Tax=Beduini sp. TaxID=1922300 RepID=UPI0039A0FFCA